MKLIFTALAALITIYFSLAQLGRTGSYLEAFTYGYFLVIMLWIGFKLGKLKD